MTNELHHEGPDAPGPADPPATPRPNSGSTFRPLWLDLKVLSDQSATLLDFAHNLRRQIDEKRRERYAFYNARRAQYDIIFKLRAALSIFGALGILLTAAAAAARFGWEQSDWDRGFLVAAMFVYAIMAAVSFFEKSLNLSTSYFRHVGILIGMRDTWTRFQFELLGELSAASVGGPDVQTAARDRIAVLGQAAWADIETLTRGEQENWQSEAQAAMTALSAVADKGRNDTDARLTQMANDAAAHRKSSADRQHAERAAKAPALLTLEITGAFAGEATILIDEKPQGVTRATKTALKPLPPGLVHLTVSARDTHGNTLAGSLNLDLKSGLQDAVVVLA